MGLADRLVSTEASMTIKTTMRWAQKQTLLTQHVDKCPNGAGQGSLGSDPSKIRNTKVFLRRIWSQIPECNTKSMRELAKGGHVF